MPTPLTAALAGVLSALLVPWAWQRFGGGSSGGVNEVLVFLLGVALPAHALVVGIGRQAPAGQGVDIALLKRVVAWLVGAGLTLAIVAALQR